MKFVDQTSFEVLPDRGNSAADPDVLALCRFAGAGQRSVNPVSHKVKRRTASHLDRCARVMCEYKNGHVIGRSVAPPAFPLLVRPVAPNRPEHIAPENPCAEVG